jgi:hypothetical protein
MHRQAEVFAVIAAVPYICAHHSDGPRERQREIRLLISMGAKRGIIFFLVIAESLVLVCNGGSFRRDGKLCYLLPAEHAGRTQQRTSGLICHGRFSRDRFDGRNGIPGSYRNPGHIFTPAGLTQQYKSL